MKKSRPATRICVICRETERESVVQCLFRHTTTIGIREAVMNRYILNRRFETIHTPCGDVQKKTSFGYGVSRSKYEFEDLARIARENGLSLEEVRNSLP